MSQVVAVVAAWDWVLYNFRLPVARALRDAGMRVILIAPSGDYVDRLRAEGFDFEPWAVDRRRLNPITGVGPVRDLAAIYRRREIDAALHFTMKPVFLGTVAARLARVPLVINTFTGLGYLFGPSPRSRLVRMALVPYARVVLNSRRSLLVVQNQWDREALQDARWISKQAAVTVVDGSGVDVDAFTSERQSDDVVTVVFAGRLLRSKGLVELVDAARILATDSPDVQVQIFGAPDSGNPDSLDEDVIAAWKSEGVVDLRGHVDDMVAEWANADIAVLPSEREGLSRFLLEAAAAGVPAIATDVAGNRDVIDHGETGLLLPDRDPVGLASAIRLLASDPERRAAMGINARAKAVARYSASAVAAEYVAMVGGRNSADPCP